MAVTVLQDQYQKSVLGRESAEQVAYRATGGAAQNMSMADMIATHARKEYQLGMLGG